MVLIAVFETLGSHWETPVVVLGQENLQILKVNDKV